MKSTSVVVDRYSLDLHCKFNEEIGAVATMQRSAYVSYADRLFSLLCHRPISSQLKLGV